MGYPDDRPAAIITTFIKATETLFNAALKLAEVVNALPQLAMLEALYVPAPKLGYNNEEA